MLYIPVRHILLIISLLSLLFSGWPVLAADLSNTDNPVIAAIMERHSVRQYLDKQVPEELLKTIVECGINAPSARNSQPWQVRVVTNSEFIKKATAIYISLNKGSGQEKGFKNIFRNAPAVIFVAGPKNGSGTLDCGMLGENILLAAQSLKLGTCVLGGVVAFMKKSPEMKLLLSELTIPDEYELLYAIAIGYPAEEPASKPRDWEKVRFLR